MGKKLAKGKEGNVTKYIGRAQAIKKLQINLAQFRRLCILKGIYPVEPKNKRKINGGSTALKTFYYRKDISYLLHEPILGTFRQEQIHSRKLGKAMGKKEFAVAKQLMDDKPVYTLDHIIKERYPTFIDAIRDLDDCLSMISLFATLPSTDDEKIKGEHIKECQRLLAEFQNYIIKSGSLKKTFLSIKGIYYQAEIRGQSVTWIAPYQFAQSIPHDVDFRVMSTFLEVHETLLAFVNYKLYSDLNLIYPPKLDRDSFDSAAGLQAYDLEAKESPATETAPSVPKVTKEQKKQFKSKLKSLEAKLEQIKHDDEINENSEDNESGEEESEDSMDEDDQVPEPVVEPTTKEEKVVKMAPEVQQEKRLFSNCVFWISREVPQYSLEFVIKSAGGRCGWDASVGSGSPFEMNDSRITHHLTDRPMNDSNSSRIEGREYLQPQWVYDSMNASKLIKTNNYHPGEKLPSHLSPFVVAGEDDYSPEQELEDEQEEVEEASMEQDHYEEIQAEAAGIPFSEFNAAKQESESTKKVKTISAADKEAKEAKELSKIMMSKRDKKVYDKIQFGKARKQVAAKKLIEKKRKSMKSNASQ